MAGNGNLLSVEEQIRIVTDLVKPIGTEKIPLKEAAYRVIAQDVLAKEDVPPFRRSPLDGYAFRSVDVKDASPQAPVVLKVLEEIPAGGVSHFEITKGTAVRIMTGAPLPDSADCMINYEATEFTEEEVKIFRPVEAGSNVILPGEDTKKGTLLAKAGMPIDSGLAGTLAGQNIAEPEVFKIPKIGIITTGSELVEVGCELEGGKIHDSNAYTLTGAIKRIGCEPVLYGIAGDDIDTITERIVLAAEECDAVVLTGGVSVGDFDYTPAAMEKAGANILFAGAKLKPGMACAYGERKGKLIAALSGNPTSSVVNFLVIARPALCKLSGRNDWEPRYIRVTLKSGYPKPSKGTRLIHGTLDLTDGTVRMDLASRQGNVIISSSIGSDVIAIIPAGSGPLEPGAELKAFLI